MDEDFEEKGYRACSLQFTVFVAVGEAWGTYGHLVSQTRRVILYLIYLKSIYTNVLTLIVKNKSLCVVSACPPLPPGTAYVHLTVVRAQGVSANLNRRCQVFLKGIQAFHF